MRFNFTENWRFAIKTDLDNEEGSRKKRQWIFEFRQPVLDDVTEEKKKIHESRIERRSEREKKVPRRQ